jgi:hypothetical protein
LNTLCGPLRNLCALGVTETPFDAESAEIAQRTVERVPST